MIKKLSFIAIIGIIAYGMYTVSTNGMILATFEIPSYSYLLERNSELDTKIQNLEDIRTRKHDEAQLRLKAAKQGYEASKNTYEDLTTLASEDEIAEANKREEYLLDYLWIKVGNYATDNNIKVKMEHVPDLAMLNFDVSGAYISIINFIYDIENDSGLAFNVDNLIMEGGSSDYVTKATFSVSGINVVTTLSE